MNPTKMAKRESSPGISPAKKQYGIEAGQILMQNIQERLTVLWPSTGASSRRTARFAVSITASLMAGLTTSIDMGKAKSILNFSTDFFKKSQIFRALSRIFFFRNLTCLVMQA